MTEAIAPPSPAFEAICGNILRCEKKINLYPLSHPRIAAALAEIQAALVAWQRETGEAFTLETAAALGDAERRDDSFARRDSFQLARLLQLRLVQKVTLAAEASAEELFQFCDFLREDRLKDPKAGEALVIDPKNWKTVQILLYRLEDLPVGGGTGPGPYRPAHGSHRRQDLEALLIALPAAVRDDVEKALGDHEFARRVTRLRLNLSSHAPVNEAEEGERFDLVAEALRMVIASTRPEDREALRAGDVISTLDRFLTFVERNLDSIASGLKSYPEGGYFRKLREQILSAAAADGALIADASTVQRQKQRLKFLFQTKTVEEPAPGKAESARPEPDPAAREARQPEAVKPAVSPPIVFPAELEVEPPGQLETARQYLRTILEVLADEHSRPAALASWPVILRTLIPVIDTSLPASEAVQELAEFQREFKLHEVEELVIRILLHIQSQGEVLRVLEKILLPAGGEAAVDSFLNRYVRHSPERGVALLCHLYRRGSASLGKLAEDRLVALAREPALLSAWVSEDPTCLKRKGLQKELSSLTPAQIRSAFRDFFRLAAQERATALLVELPVALAAVEEILFAAMEHGSPLTRRLAILQLGRYRSPQVTKTLIEIVRLNNFKEEPALAEVEAALTALLRQGTRNAHEFLQDVLRRRRHWIIHVYRRSIRKILSSLLSSKKVP